MDCCQACLEHGDHRRLVHHDDRILTAAAGIGTVERPEVDDTPTDQLNAFFLLALIAHHRGQNGQQFPPRICHEFVGRAKPGDGFTLQCGVNQSIYPQLRLAPAAPATEDVEALGLLDDLGLRRVRRR